MSSIRIRPDQEILIKRLGINLSQFIKDKIDEVYQDPQRIKEEIDTFKQEIKIRETLMKEIINERTKLTKREMAYLVASKGILAKHGKESSFFTNRFNSFTSQFEKKFITLDIFFNMVVASK